MESGLALGYIFSFLSRSTFNPTYNAGLSLPSPAVQPYRTRGNVVPVLGAAARPTETSETKGTSQWQLAGRCQLVIPTSRASPNQTHGHGFTLLQPGINVAGTARYKRSTVSQQPLGERPQLGSANPFQGAEQALAWPAGTERSLFNQVTRCQQATAEPCWKEG